MTTPKDGDFEILSAACDVAAFSKMNAYPVEFSPAFFTFAQKLDRLATAINARYPGFNLNCRTSAKPETTPPAPKDGTTKKDKPDPIALLKEIHSWMEASMGEWDAKFLKKIEACIKTHTAK